MSFKRGPTYRVFVSTENETLSIDCSGEIPLASTETSGVGFNAATKGVGVRGSVDDPSLSATQENELKNLEGIDPTWQWEDDPFTVFGQTRPLDNPIRKKWEVVLTKKGEDKTLAKISDGARFGVTGSDTTSGLFDGLDTLPDDTGYRVYVWDGESYYIGYQGSIVQDGYKETLSPTGITVQAVTIGGGNWSASVNTDSDGVTASMDITQ